MNKLIKDLVQQAREEVMSEITDSNPPIKIGSDYFLYMGREILAKLIIKECIEVLRLVPYEADGPEFGEEIVYQEAVKNHFGVEL